MKYTATPSERLDYAPEARLDPEILKRVRARHFEEVELRVAYQNRFRWCYNIAIILFMCGLWALLFPHYFRTMKHFKDLSAWPWGNVIALIAITLAIVIEFIWMVRNGTKPAFVLPQPSKQPQVDRLKASTENVSAILFPNSTEA